MWVILIFFRNVKDLLFLNAIVTSVAMGTFLSLPRVLNRQSSVRQTGSFQKRAYLCGWTRCGRSQGLPPHTDAAFTAPHSGPQSIM